jgi:hypothetical protein
MERHAEDLVEVVVSEVGSPISLSRSMQVDDGFREFFQVKHLQWPIR